MKKGFLLLLLISLGSLIFADEAVLLDFNKLKADSGTENTATTLDCSSYLPGKLDNAKISLSLANWTVALNNSAKYYQNQSLCEVKEAASKDGVVMGVRVNFPETQYAASADILPPYEIPVFNDQNIDFTASLGVIKNISCIKTIKVNVCGRNSPYSLYLLLKNQNNDIIQVLLGSIQFSGWKEMTWENLSYINDVKLRDVKTMGTIDYPNLISTYVKFYGFRIVKQGDALGGDSVLYIKDIKITYDKAAIASSDFDDETVWGIAKSREIEKNKEEMKKIATEMYLRKQEYDRMDHPVTK